MSMTKTQYDTRHGGAYQSTEVLAQPGSPEWEAYMAGYEHNEQFGDKKDWG